MVYSTKIDGIDIVVIKIPRASRQVKPIAVNGKHTGIYRRNDEGSYLCSDSEVRSMNRDASESTIDNLLLDNVPINALDFDTLHRYRNRFSYLRSKHVWNEISDEEFLCKIGAASINFKDNKVHPTIAGLLVFGYEYEIIKEFPQYFLDYREPFDDLETKWIDRVVSFSGDWSGNIYDFYFKILERLTSDLKVPFHLLNGLDRLDDTRMHQAVREGLANALIHSDYYERKSVVIEKRKNSIIISNPGSLRISKGEAFSGGISDARNSIIKRIFDLAGIKEPDVCGLSNIQTVWNNYGYNSPSLKEQFGADRTILVLPLDKTLNTSDTDFKRI